MQVDEGLRAASDEVLKRDDVTLSRRGSLVQHDEIEPFLLTRQIGGG